ncbi:uncharacterized protein BDR25DRAFT_278009 [Lindgomyces ingoldianus]|uniref:Uncharacterized protein n=1 Tax=Lindgomyces ingoldianus TaxID=673940 RepID=A0ACB6RBK8_9PLEO|nr:uncharacterized protein BDR25DRAFT_278009 [Lindgomyces ingoldianus]KAF2476704.1 hypothetical protein BDR25DRAFT_278009 [Lindgomyces ingoldianus]
MARLRPSRLLFTALIVIFLFWTLLARFSFARVRGYSILTDPPTATSPDVSHVSHVSLGEECSPFAGGGMDNVTIVVKLGAAEVSSKLAAYLDVIGPCSPDLLLFSDRYETYKAYTILDALANLPAEYKGNNPDFAAYDDIQRSNRSLAKTTDGWKLDKYKFLPMMDMVAQLRPHSHWFFFVEPDTYVNWDNVYRFLGAFDPDQPLYFGSPVWPPKKTVFAHGGSGIVLSHRALNKLITHGQKYRGKYGTPGAHQFGKNLSNECCGDEVLAQVLKECGVSLRGYWPMFNGEKPTTVRFGPEHWCEAIVTLHHLQEGDFAKLHAWEASRQHPSTPLTFAELFRYIEHSVQSQMDDWTNMSEDATFTTPHSAGESFDNCLDTCLRDRKCVQYEHFGGTCRLSYTTRMGHERLPEGNKRWTSGWVKDRIEAFKAAHSPCLGAHFVHPNP